MGHGVGVEPTGRLPHLPDLLAQLGIERPPLGRDIRVHFGGPVDTGRGFVLHSADYSNEGAVQMARMSR